MSTIQNQSIKNRKALTGKDALKGKNIIITGASEGLGRQLAKDFAIHGAEALVLVARNKERLESLEKVIHQISSGTRVVLIDADLSDTAQPERVLALAMNALGGRLDVLVNNASYLGPTPMPILVDYPLDGFEKVLRTNLLAPFLLIQKALPALIASEGSIINVTSDAGVTGYAGWGAYGISKFGLEGLSQTWAAELEDSGVRVNWVDPGNMNTAMHRAAEPEEDPNQWANPADVTEIFVYLASDQSKDVNGQRFRAQEDDELEVEVA
jgi:Dehydrogenases with different specificities (related to short-chain alcohol dehydrogenases)